MDQDAGLKRECWNAPEDRDTTADNQLPANQMNKSITNQQVGVIWMAEDSLSHKEQADDLQQPPPEESGTPADTTWMRK